MMSLLVDAAAWLSFGLIFSSFLGYPLALVVLSRSHRLNKPSHRATTEYVPVVSLIVACYNEEAFIEEKLLNSIALNYPREKFEIIVFSDGSTDSTESIVAKYSDLGVKLVCVQGRLGKTHCQNLVASEARGEVLVFSDANTLYSSDAIEKLVGSLAPEDVGVAVGRRVYTGAGKVGNSEGLYERFENWIKAKESLVGGTIGANGSMYAVKAALYIELPIDRMSDIVEPIRVAAKHKKRIVFVSDAVGAEQHDNEFQAEFKRKRRIVLRAMNSLWLERESLIVRPDLLIKFMFHKVLRWLTLPLMLAGVAASAFSDNRSLVFLGTVAFAYLSISLSLFIFVWFVRGGKPGQVGRIASILLYSIGVFLSASIACWDFLRGRNIRVWESRT